MVKFALRGVIPRLKSLGILPRGKSYVSLFPFSPARGGALCTGEREASNSKRQPPVQDLG